MSSVSILIRYIWQGLILLVVDYGRKEGIVGMSKSRFLT